MKRGTYLSLCARLKAIKKLASQKQLDEQQKAWLCSELDVLISRLPYHSESYHVPQTSQGDGKKEEVRQSSSNPKPNDLDRIVALHPEGQESAEPQPNINEGEQKDVERKNTESN